MEMSYERLAMRGDPMPAGLSQEDQLCYQALCFLYKRYNTGQISREVGSDEARQIRMRCAENKKTAEFGRKCSQHSVRLWRAVEQASNNYQKNRTLENADQLITAIYGVGFP